MRKSLGDKRREIPLERAQDILKILADFKDGDTRKVTKDGKEEEVVVSRIFPTTHFGFRKITVERPLRLNFQANPERIARLEEEKRLPGARAVEEEGRCGRKGAEPKGRALAGGDPPARARAPGHAVQGPRRVRAGARRRREEGRTQACRPRSRKAILSALSERDETAAICRDKDGNPEPDPGAARHRKRAALREHRRRSLQREVKPHVPDAWIDTDKRDPKDGQVGLVGYEINFNRYFYRYTPPRPLEEIEADIRGIESDIIRMLAEVTGNDG